MTRAELILKCVMAPGEPANAFVENYLRLINDHDVETFRQVVEMKGYKKSDTQYYIEIFRRKISEVKAAVQANAVDVK
jgi:hypothetical protein